MLLHLGEQDLAGAPGMGAAPVLVNPIGDGIDRRSRSGKMRHACRVPVRLRRRAGQLRENLRWVTPGAAMVRTSRSPARLVTPSNRRSPDPSRMGTR
jgi:hypothetical protein